MASQNGNEPATKGDLAALEQRLGSEMKALEQRLGSDMKALEQRLGSDMKTMEDRLVEVFRDGQTEGLKAFYAYAESTDLKLRDSAATDANLRERLSVVERRLTDLERKVSFPNQP